MLIMINEHDTISRHDTHECDKSYKMSGRYNSSREPNSENSSEPPRDNTEKYLKHEYNTSKMSIKDSKKSKKDTNRDKHQKF
jgi:hypothetical protein